MCYLNTDKEDFAYDCVYGIQPGGYPNRLVGVLGMTKTAHLYAGVSELVYETDLKSVAREGLRDRGPSPAPVSRSIVTNRKDG